MRWKWELNALGQTWPQSTEFWMFMQVSCWWAIDHGCKNTFNWVNTAAWPTPLTQRLIVTVTSAPCSRGDSIWATLKGRPVLIPSLSGNFKASAAKEELNVPCSVQVYVPNPFFFINSDAYWLCYEMSVAGSECVGESKTGERWWLWSGQTGVLLALLAVKSCKGSSKFRCTAFLKKNCFKLFIACIFHPHTPRKKLKLDEHYRSAQSRCTQLQRLESKSVGWGAR